MKQCRLPTVGDHSRRVSKWVHPRIERLEERTLLSINWWNKNGLGDTFTADERNLIEQAIEDWETILPLVSFSVFITGGSMSGVDITDCGGGPALGCAGEYMESGGLPTSASITIDADAMGLGWFIDPTPTDNAEFPTLVTPYFAQGGPAGIDMYSTVLHELGHAIGFANAYSNFAGHTLPGADGEGIFIFFNSSFTAILPQGDWSHIDPTVPSHPWQFGDLMGPTIGVGQRNLITSLDVDMFREAYGAWYSGPGTETLPTFHAVYNSDTDVLTINASPNGSDVTIGYVNPDQVHVNVDGHLSVFSKVSLSQIDFVGGAGSDHVTVSLDTSSPIPDGGLTFTGGGSGYDILTFEGTFYDEKFSITSNDLKWEGHSFTYSVADADVVELWAGDGKDVVEVGGVPTNVDSIWIHGGGGDDQIHLSPVYQNLDYLTVPLAVNGDADSDTVTVNDQANASPHTYSINDHEVKRDSFSLLAFCEDLQVNTGSKSNKIEVAATHPGTKTTVHAGQASDDFVVTWPFGTHTVDHIKSHLTLDGGGGANELEIDDSGNIGSRIVTVTDTTVGADPNDTFFAPDGKITYQSMDELRLYMGSGVNTVIVTGTKTNTDVSIFGGGSADAFLVDSNGTSPGGTVDGIKSLLEFDGGGGTNTLTFEDSSDNTADTVTVTPTTVGAGANDSFLGTNDGATYVGIAVLTLNMGSGADTPIVLGTGAELHINGAMGGDYFLVDSNGTAAGGLANGVKHALTIDGGADGGTLVLQDASERRLTNVTITATTVGATAGDNFFGPGGKLVYSSLGELTLYMGKGTNQVNVEATATGTATNVWGGSGNDSFLVDSNGPAPGGTVNGIVSGLAIYGGAGVNSALLQDGDDLNVDKLTLTDTRAGAGSSDSFFGNFGSLSYNGLASLTINLGRSGSEVNVQATAVGTATNLNGDAGSDQFLIDSNGREVPGGTANNVVSTLTVQGGGGLNTLSMEDTSDVTPDTATFTATQIGSAPSDSLFGPLGKVIYSAMGSVELFGGSAGNTLHVTGSPAGTALALYSGAGIDTVFVANASNSLGAQMGTLFVNGQGASDSVFVTDEADSGAHSYVLGAGTLARDSVTKLTYSAIESLDFVASNFNDLITVDGTASGTPTIVRAGIGTDTINVGTASKSLDNLMSPVSIYGLGGPDTLSVTDQAALLGHAYALTASTLARDGATLVTYGSVENLGITTSGFIDTFLVQGTAAGLPVTVTGGNGVDMLAGANNANHWLINGTNAGDLNGTVAFNAFEWLTGGSASDQFEFSNVGSVSGLINGLGGPDTLDYSDYTSNVAVNLQTNTATGTGGFAGIEDVIGGNGSDQLIGENAANTWNIVTSDRGNVNGTFTFASFENLTGGTNIDMFVFSNSFGVSGSINGGGGTGKNALNYSAYTSSVQVNLTTSSATNVAGGVSGIADVYGGAADDMLIGNGATNALYGLAGDDVLLGAGGADDLNGGAGRDLLIAGLGVDRLSGNQDDDILIGGTTTHDGNTASFAAIMAEWTRTDLTYAQRIDHLRNGGGLNGQIKLNSSTVFDDSASDFLTGSTGLDWFWATLSGAQQDSIADKEPNEVVN